MRLHSTWTEANILVYVMQCLGLLPCQLNCKLDAFVGYRCIHPELPERWANYCMSESYWKFIWRGHRCLSMNLSLEDQYYFTPNGMIKTITKLRGFLPSPQCLATGLSSLTQTTMSWSTWRAMLPSIHRKHSCPFRTVFKGKKLLHQDWKSMFDHLRFHLALAHTRYLGNSSW